MWTVKEIIEHAAAELRGARYPVVLLDYGTKKASFKAWQERDPLTRAELQSHTRRRLYNLGIWLGREEEYGRLMVVDIDGGGIEWARERGMTSPMIARTSKGLHLYMRHLLGEQRTRIHPNGELVDFKFSGYCVAPPSWNEEAGFRYEWVSGPVPPEELTLFREEWLPRAPARDVRVEIPDGDMVARARAYLATVEGAVSGQGGHKRTFRAACVLVQKFGLSGPEAWPLLLEWNEKCQPPWSERELLHKLEDALKKRG